MEGSVKATFSDVFNVDMDECCCVSRRPAHVRYQKTDVSPGKRRI
jgi:hypothetical protein